MTNRKLLFVAAASALLAAPACDLNKTASQLTARHVVVGTLLHTPQVEIKPEAIAGFDASFAFDASLPDGGVMIFDGGAFFADAGLIVPPQTGVFAFLGTRNGEGLDQSPPSAVAGSTMKMEEKGITEYELKETAAGTFQLTTVELPTLKYTDNGDYVFTAKGNGETFVAIAEKVPGPERIPEFHPVGKSFIDQQVNTELVLHRPDPPTGQPERYLGFVIVIPVDRDGKQGAPSYTNLPKTPLDYLKLVLAPLEYKAAVVKVPKEAFPEANKNYLVLLQNAKLGRPESDNLFTGSAILAGTADVGIVKTRP